MFTSVHKFPHLNNEFVKAKFLWDFYLIVVQQYKVFALNYFPLNNSILICILVLQSARFTGKRKDGKEVVAIFHCFS